jgi:hypothetical protein
MRHAACDSTGAFGKRSSRPRDSLYRGTTRSRAPLHVRAVRCAAATVSRVPFPDPARARAQLVSTRFVAPQQRCPGSRSPAPLAHGCSLRPRGSLRRGNGVPGLVPQPRSLTDANPSPRGSRNVYRGPTGPLNHGPEFGDDIPHVLRLRTQLLRRDPCSPSPLAHGCRSEPARIPQRLTRPTGFVKPWPGVRRSHPACSATAHSTAATRRRALRRWPRQR